MTKVRVGLMIALVGGALLVWGLLSTPGWSCTYSGDTGGCELGVTQGLAEMAGMLLLVISGLVLLSSLLSGLKRRHSN